MYMDDDTLTPRDRIGDEMLRRMLEMSDGATPDLPPVESRQSPCLPHGGWGLHDHPVGMVYAPLQHFRNLYDRETALRQGTIFRELDLPFHGESVANGSGQRNEWKGGSCRG